MKQLAGIATRAARLSYRLWTQKTRLAILGLEDLGLGGDDEVKTFGDGAELLHYHAYHNVEHSRDNGCLDGKPIVMITHPAVIAYGDSSGDNYAEYKVWKKAEAWMG